MVSLFINDLTNRFKCLNLMLRDDVKLYSWIGFVNVMQDDLNFLVAWCNCNRLKLSVSKLCVMSFCSKHSYVRYQYKISGVNKYKDLGVTFDKRFTFNGHISDTIKTS